MSTCWCYEYTHFCNHAGCSSCLVNIRKSAWPFRQTWCLSRSDTRRQEEVKNLDFLMLWYRFSQSYEVHLVQRTWNLHGLCRLTWCSSACLTFKVQNLDLVMKWHPFQSTGWQSILVDISRISLIEKACSHWEENILCCAGASIFDLNENTISSVQDSSTSALLLIYMVSMETETWKPRDYVFISDGLVVLNISNGHSFCT